MLVIQKKKHQIHQPLDDQQGPGLKSNSLWMKSSPGAWHVRQQGLDAHVAPRGVATKSHPAASDILHPAHAEICGESCGFS